MNIETGHGPRRPDGNKPKSPVVYHSRRSRIVDKTHSKSKSPSPMNNNNNNNRFKNRQTSDNKTIWRTGGKRKSRRRQRKQK
jgi:hypothetical protein